MRRASRHSTRAEPLTDGTSLMASQQDWATVGQLYRSIEEGLAYLVERDGEDEVFIGSRRDQARWQAFHWAEITPVVDMASARVAIEHVVEQGEGARANGARPTSASSWASSTSCAR